MAMRDVRELFVDTHVLIYATVEDNRIVLKTLGDLLQKISVSGKQIHDANIVATMMTHGIRHLLTHNTGDFTRFSAFITVLPLEVTENEP